MIYGTHNSATGGKLVWWLRPFAWVINPTSKCQDNSIDEQLQDGVKLFNLQVAYDGKRWYFSHGLALYKEDVIETIAMIKSCATEKEPIYFSLYLDKSFWCKSNREEFEALINQLRKEFCNNNFVMLYAWDEGANYHCYCSGVKINLEEQYWTLRWGKTYGKSWIDKLPLPKRHAIKYNKKYIDNCKCEYLMLDFYDRK